MYEGRLQGIGWILSASQSPYLFIASTLNDSDIGAYERIVHVTNDA